MQQNMEKFNSKHILRKKAVCGERHLERHLWVQGKCKVGWGPVRLVETRSEHISRSRLLGLGHMPDLDLINSLLRGHILTGIILEYF